jgi:hypothetical protein
MSETETIENGNIPVMSDTWEKRFNLLKKIGADEKFLYQAMKSSEFKELSFKEKNSVYSNLLAFLFGPLYYFSKNMWIKGAIFLGFSWLLMSVFTIIELAFDTELPIAVYYMPTAVLCTQLANYDYFRKVMYGEKIWGGFPSIFEKPVVAIGFPVVALLTLLMIEQAPFNDNARIDMIKNGSLRSCPHHTIEEMANGFLASPSWEHGLSDSDIEFVNLTGEAERDGKPASVTVQFTINENGETFNFQALEVNERPVNRLSAIILLKKMCDSAS